MEKDGVWELIREPTDEEDGHGIDYFVKIKNLKGYKTKSEIPIQFKLRTNPKRRDLVVARYQPCFGTDQEILPRSQNGVSRQTAQGRDWRGLMNHASILYFVATMNEYKEYDEVSYITSTTLKEHSIKLDQQWEVVEGEGKIQPKQYYTCDLISSMLNRNSYKESFCTFCNTNNDEVWYQKNIGESPKFLMYINKSRRAGFCKIDPVQLAKTHKELKKEGII